MQVLPLGILKITCHGAKPDLGNWVNCKILSVAREGFIFRAKPDLGNWVNCKKTSLPVGVEVSIAAKPDLGNWVNCKLSLLLLLKSH